MANRLWSAKPNQSGEELFLLLACEVNTFFYMTNTYMSYHGPYQLERERVYTQVQKQIMTFDVQGNVTEMDE